MRSQASLEASSRASLGMRGRRSLGAASRPSLGSPWAVGAMASLRLVGAMRVDRRLRVRRARLLLRAFARLRRGAHLMPRAVFVPLHTALHMLHAALMAQVRANRASAATPRMADPPTAANLPLATAIATT